MGDFPDSFAYDGGRVKKWTRSNPASYGQPWTPGDIIGCCIDLDPKDKSEGINFLFALCYSFHW